MLTISLGQLIFALCILGPVTFLLGFLVRSGIKGSDHQKAERAKEYEKGYKESAIADKDRAWQNYSDEHESHKETKKKVKELEAVIRQLGKREGELLESVAVWRGEILDEKQRLANEMGLIVSDLETKRKIEKLA